MAKSNKNNKKTNSTVYFAAQTTEKLGDELLNKVDEYYRHCHTTGKLNLWHRSYYMYNNAMATGAVALTGGEYDEYQIMSVNNFKNICQHLHNNTTADRISFEPQATNTDTKSQAQTLLAIGLLDYYLRDKRMERNLKQADLDAILYGEGFVAADWDANIGEDQQPEEGMETEGEAETVKEGDLSFSNFTPNNVIRDQYATCYEDCKWKIVRSFQNKFDVAARYPEYADEIIGMSSWDDDEFRTRFVQIDVKGDNDNIPVYTFYHEKTAVMPEGRMTRFLDSNLLLTDGPLPFKEVPIYREAPDEVDDSPFGSTVAWDLMPLQEVLDILYSIIITNQKTFGVQCIMSPRGANLDAGKIAEGLTHIEYTPGIDGGKPEALQLTSTPAEVFNFIERVTNDMETISGINSVVRGNPEASLKSGAALALVHSTAIQFSKGQQESYYNLVQDLGTATIQILKEYATTKRVASITGRSNRRYMKEFTGEDISDINRVIVDTGNPLTRTIAGKVNLAEMLLESGLVTTPEEYLSVLNTGRLESLVEGDQAELMLVRAENEDMADGKEVMAVLTDNHSLHIREHKAVLASTEARQDPQQVELCLSHIQDHLNILMEPTNAQMLQLLGQQPMAPEVPNPQGGEGAMNPTGDQIAQPGDVDQPNMPNMPKLPGENGDYNPLTGEADPQA